MKLLEIFSVGCSFNHLMIFSPGGAVFAAAPPVHYRLCGSHWTLYGDHILDFPAVSISRVRLERGRSANRVSNSSTCKNTRRQKEQSLHKSAVFLSFSLYISRLVVPIWKSLACYSVVMMKCKNFFLYFGISCSLWECHLEGFFFNAPKCSFSVRT